MQKQFMCASRVETAEVNPYYKIIWKLYMGMSLKSNSSVAAPVLEQKVEEHHTACYWTSAVYQPYIWVTKYLGT